MEPVDPPPAPRPSSRLGTIDTLRETLRRARERVRDAQANGVDAGILEASLIAAGYSPWVRAEVMPKPQPQPEPEPTPEPEPERRSSWQRILEEDE